MTSSAKNLSNLASTALGTSWNFRGIMSSRKKTPRWSPLTTFETMDGPLLHPCQGRAWHSAIFASTSPVALEEPGSVASVGTWKHAINKNKIFLWWNLLSLSYGGLAFWLTLLTLLCIPCQRVHYGPYQHPAESSCYSGCWLPGGKPGQNKHQNSMVNQL